MTQLQSSLTSPEKLANGPAPAAPGAAEDRGPGRGLITREPGGC